MTIYKYNAITLDSKKVKGSKEATSKQELANLLRREELYLIDCKDVTKEIKNRYKIKLNDLSLYSREIGTMLRSGLSLIRIFSIMIQREDKPKLKKIYNDIYIKLQQGITLSTAMEMQGNAFPELMIQMYRTGEATGQMEQTAMTMAEQYSKDYKLKNKVSTAMMYPAILSVVTILVVLIIYAFVLPSFLAVFENIELPLLTRINMAISAALQKYWYVFIIVVFTLVAMVTYLLQIPKIRLKFDKLKLRIPKMGKLLGIIYTARFARTLCSLYTSGISLITGLKIAQNTIGNKYIEEQFDEAIKSVRNGKTLSEAISQIDGFDIKLISSIYVGEESGSLEDMLSVLADDYDYDAEQASQKMVSLLEPVMIIVLAVIIGGIMISVLMPIFSLYQNAGSL